MADQFPELFTAAATADYLSLSFLLDELGDVVGEPATWRDYRLQERMKYVTSGHARIHEDAPRIHAQDFPGLLDAVSRLSLREFQQLAERLLLDFHEAEMERLDRWRRERLASIYRQALEDFDSDQEH